jgi:hypothetical protein
LPVHFSLRLSDKNSIENKGYKASLKTYLVCANLITRNTLCEELGNYKEEHNNSGAGILANMQRPEAPHLINQYNY